MVKNVGGGGGGALVTITFRLVHTNYSLPEKQAVKLTFFIPHPVVQEM